MMHALPRSFYFLRHGETDWNLEKRLQGHTDIPLNANGRRQAAAVVDVLRRQPIDRIVTSNLARAHETAMIINKVLRKPIIVDEDLKERNFGVMEGRTQEEVRDFRQIMKMDDLPLEENGYPCAPQAETYADFKTRVTLAINRCLHDYAGENLLFVSHGGVYRVLNRGIFNCDGTGPNAHSPNAHPLHFQRQDDAWNLSSLS